MDQPDHTGLADLVRLFQGFGIPLTFYAGSSATSSNGTLCYTALGYCTNTPDLVGRFQATSLRS
jgi:hypothetical protein